MSKIKIETVKIVPHLKKILFFIPRKPIIAIYGCFKITVNKNILQIFAFDGSKSCQTTIRCESDIEGSWAVPAKLLTDTLSLINEPEITFEFSTTHLTIKSGRKNLSKISIFDGREYPQLRVCDKNNEISYSCADFKKDIYCMLGFADPENSKEVFHGVHLKMDNKEVYFEAANDFIIGQIKSETRSILKWANILVSADVCKVVADSLDDRDIIKIYHDGKQIMFSSKDYDISSTVIDKKYPDCNAVFDKFSKGRHVKLDSYQTEVAFKKVRMYANGDMPYEANMTFSEKELQIKAYDIFFNNEIEEYLDLNENEGVDCSVVVRADQLLGVIQAIGDGELLLFVNSPSEPIYGRKSSSDSRRFVIAAIKPR